MKESSRYEYEINIEDKNTTVVKQLNFIGINKKVLEFGCSTGYISKILKEKGCAITGIEIDEEASKKAAAYCERVIIGDIETIDYDKQLGNEKFDVALFGDILEHLKDPKTILLKVKDFLKEKGYIVISIPNVAHWSVRLDLTCGKFDYQDSGILDDTHLRFFTKSSIINLLESCGYYVTYMDEVRQEVDWNKVGTVMRLKNLNDADLKNFSSLLNDTEAGVFQYVLKAAPSSDLEHLKKISAEKINLEERIQIFEGQITAFSGQLTDKERQINALTATIQGKDEQIKILDGQITNISGQHKEKDKQIEKLNLAVHGKDVQISNFERQIANISSQLTGKDKQIDVLNVAVQGKEEQLRALGERITDFSSQLTGKDKQIEVLNVAVRGKDEQIRALGERITDFSSQLTGKDKQIEVLNVAVRGKDEQIRALGERITDFSGQLTGKDKQIEVLNVAVRGKDEQILNFEGEIANIFGQLTEKEGRLREIEMENLRINTELNSIKSSVTWGTVMKWHSLVEYLIPPMTRRRRWYDLSLIGLRTIANEGWSSFWWNYKQHKRSKKHTELIAKSTEERILETFTDKIELPEESLDTFKSYKLLNLLSQPGVNLSFPKSDEPVVSIITLTFNKAEFTYQYLESIIAHTDIPYELIIVDNGSHDETTSLLDRLENVTIIKNNKNLGFIKGCNQGARKARGKYLVFLNNDIIVTPEWLSKLVKTIERYPKCGAVGCKLIWPNGKLQEAGSIIWNDGSALGYGREGDPMHPEYSYLREVDYCSGACLLVRKDIFQQLGEFDERYIPAYYEDSDLCLGIWELGYKVVFQADVAVFHNEFTSSSINKATAIMAANQSKFVAKRKDTLKDKFNPSPNNVLFARDLRQGDRMLVIDDRVPTPYQGSGYPRAYHMLNFLGELGYKVTFFPLDNATPWQPYTNELQQLGIEVFYGDNLDFIRFAQDRAGYYDLVLVSRPHNMEMAVDAVKRFFSNAVLLYDAEALFSMRAILKAKVKGIKLRAKDAERMINGEMDLLNKADLIITVSENEKKMIVERGNLNNIAVWGHPIDVKSPKNDFHERKDILFVGGFLASESPNEDAVLYFAKEVFPKLRKEISCRFFIAGINPPDSIKKLSSSSVIVTGYVEDLREYYEKCRIFIVPHRYSAGIPWKLQEAMSYGIPSVVSELTASQLDLTDGNEVLVAKSSDEFVQKIIKLYQDEKLWYTVQRNAVEYIQKTCKSEVIKNSLHKIIMKGLQIKTKP